MKHLSMKSLHRTSTLLLLALIVVLAHGTAHAQALSGPSTQPSIQSSIQPVPDRTVEREQLLERLVDAQNAFLSWNIAGAKARLDRLVTDLAHDTTPFNQAVRNKASEIVTAIEASHLRDAETKLAALIKAVRDGVMPSFAGLGDSAAM